MVRSTATAANASWDILNEKLTTLESNTARYNELVILLCKTSVEVTATEIKIEESIVQLDDYIAKITEVRTLEIVTFREIEELLNPPQEVTPNTSSKRQSQSMGSNQPGRPVIFRPQADLKPRFLQRDCTLNETENFILSFKNNMQSGHNGSILTVLCITRLW